MSDGKDKSQPPSDDGFPPEGEPNAEGALKRGYEDKKYERGVGNRKPEKPPEGESKTELSVGPFYKWDSNIRGELMASRAPGSQEASFAQFMQGKVGEIEAGAASINLTEAKARAVVFKAKAEASVVHAELDLVDLIAKLLITETKKPPAEPPSVAAVPPPMAARLGDRLRMEVPSYPASQVRTSSSAGCQRGGPASTCTYVHSPAQRHTVWVRRLPAQPPC